MTAAVANLQMDGNLLVCFALKEEAAPFQKIVAGKPGVTVLVVGIGRQNAERSVRAFLAGRASNPANPARNHSLHQPSTSEAPAAPVFVLTCGFAGGLNPELKLGDILFETGDENLRARLLSAGARPAGFFCADRIAISAGEKASLRRQTGADVVEMESEAIQEVCREYGIPCATVRVISDTAAEDLPLDFNALAKPDKSLDFGRLFLAIARSPGKIPALMQLQKQTNSAARELASVVARVIFP